jgi:hypothetical protein
MIRGDDSYKRQKIPKQCHNLGAHSYQKISSQKTKTATSTDGRFFYWLETQ